MTFQGAIAFSILLFFSPCLSAAECADWQSNYELTSCLAKEVKKAEIDITYAYQRALEAIEAHQGRSDSERANQRTNFIKAQKAWIAYKKAQCNGVVANQWAGGTGMPQAVFSCGLEHARMHIKELENSSK